MSGPTTHQTASERRRFHRITFDASATIEQGNQHWPVTLVDISLKGVLVELHEDWENADGAERFLINVTLAEPEAHIKMFATLAHQEGLRLGFESIEIDIESASFLRRLIELNLGEPELLERELSVLLSTRMD